jgi:Na+/melibiose symporter-like transporter
LFFPPVRGPALLGWALVALTVTYTAYSMVSIAHQSWGARLGGDALQRSRIVAWREGLALLGVMLASVLPLLAGHAITTLVFMLALALGMFAWLHAPTPPIATPALRLPRRPLWYPLQRPGFISLLVVFILNGIASAIPATLVLFFIQDLLHAPPHWEAAFLTAYFLAATLSITLWLRAIRRWGLWRCWLGGMLLAIATFAWAATLARGDIWPFVAVCVFSGAALGADLTVPPALLAGLIQSNGDHAGGEGSYFGWWNFATKLNLALAAGLALPALAWFGYSPGASSGAALQALVTAYCLIPCALKLIAFCVLFISVKANKFT